jgi:hypothetical protein
VLLSRAPRSARSGTNSELESETQKWWSVNVGTYRATSRSVSPELTNDIVSRLREGETVEFPDRYDLEHIKGGFGGSFSD